MIQRIDFNENIFDANNYPLDNGIRLIEASAGTGKTFSIAHLVIRLLTEKKLLINEILIVSFTKASASELKSIICKRICETLKALENLNSGKPNENIDLVLIDWLQKKVINKDNNLYWSSLLLEALDNIEQADITTIHGFCYRTIKRDALQIGSIINPVIQEEDSKIIKDIAYEYWTKNILELNPNDIKGLTDAGLKIEILIDSIKKIENDPTLRFDLSNKFIDTKVPLLNQYNQSLKAYWYNFCSEWKINGSGYDFYLRNICNELNNKDIKDTKPYSLKPRIDRSQLISKWIKRFSHGNLSSDYNIPYYIDIREQKKLLESYYHPKNLYEIKSRNNIKELSEFKSNIGESISNLWDGPIELVWEHALSCCLERLQSKRKELGELTNADLLKALDPKEANTNKDIKSKSSNSVLFKKLRLRYKAALVDEFQDTDQLQWRFLKHTFGNNNEHLLLMIGDPKQAIYKFRGGDLNTYIKARSEAERIDILKSNYRTTPILMEGLNKLMKQGLKKSGLKIHSLKPCSNNEPLSLAIDKYPLQLITIDDNSSSENLDKKKLNTKTDLEEHIPNVITSYLLDLIRTHSSELQLKDICILVNNHNQAESIRSALSTAGLPTNLISKGDILKSDAALILQRFLNCLANPGNSFDLRLLACSALIQWNIKELKEAENNGDLDKLASKLLYWSQNLERLGLSGCLSEILEIHTLADLSKRGKLLNDLQQCAQLVQEEIYRQGLDAKSAAKWLSRERMSDASQVGTERQPNSDIDNNSITILTIHKSKGLQFNIVICPYLWQAPAVQKGPLWRVDNSQNWLLSVGKGIRAGKSAYEESIIESIKEYERLAYVALTRARKHLVIVWGRALKQEGNPLINFLFGPHEINSQIKQLTDEKLVDWLGTNNIPISIQSIKANKILKYSNNKQINENFSLGPKPNRILDKTWGRFSYSSWTTELNESFKDSTDNLQFEEGRDSDQQNIENHQNTILGEFSSIKSNLNSKNIWTEENPLSVFPRGSTAGECLHKILEKLNFQDLPTSKKSKELIIEELSKSGFDTELLSSVQKGLKRILNVPLAGGLHGLKLREISQQNRIHELKFDLPLSLKGKPINSVDISNAFKNNPHEKYGESYSKQLLNLKINSRGFLTGSIDLVFADNDDHSLARWWVADWKSNWLGSTEKNLISCGPHHYDTYSMEQEMLSHHYPLQAHLYLVALHRLLKWRLPNYSPEKHLGGYVYIFIRGIPGEKIIETNSTNKEIPGLIIEKAPLKRLIEIDQIIERGGL